MPDYRAIYNHIVQTESRYNLAENSPGFRAVTQATEQLKMISGRALDVGCGVGFVVEYLSSPTFDLLAFGADISDSAIEKSKQRLAGIAGSVQRLMVLENQSLPYDDDFFSLVTCFDVLEHLDAVDIRITASEIERVLRPGGIFFGSVSCRKSGVTDPNGDNLHRTVQSVDWWIEQLKPDQAEFDAVRRQLKIWKRFPLVKSERKNAAAKRKQLPQNIPENQDPVANEIVADSAKFVSVTAVEFPAENATGKTSWPQSDIVPLTILADQFAYVDQDTNSTGDNSAALYQQIYDENPWYGNADENRCPGVRLLPKYSQHLLDPVLDLGCGRGHTVERLRELGMKAEGIDQISNHPGMRVGDITQPVADIEQFNSVVCVDCIEHLYPNQLAGLFENMKLVKRQAFSIHNGESTGTGQELHVNRKSFAEWEQLISEHLEIDSQIPITPEQMLFLTRSKK